MKTRIFSGAALILIVAAVFWLQMYLPVILVIAAAALCATAVFEILYNTGFCRNKFMVALGFLPAITVPFVMLGYINIPLSVVYTLYAVIAFALILKFHSQLSIQGILSCLVFPILLSYAFSSVVFITQFGDVGLFYILAVICWSALADTGAYFVGVVLGRHKMAKVISPKKSWEGFVGGMLFGIIGSYLLCLLYDKGFGYDVNYLLMLCIAPLFIAVGVLGDLSTSIIKRKCEIKDFGSLIPGHGGIMDRFDSILMISSLFASVVANISLIK